MKVIRKIIEIDEPKCTGCGLCVTGCAEGALAIIEGKAKIVKETYCDGLGACLGECPEGALKLVEREADEFDEAEVHAHLEAMESPADTNAIGRCPSSAIQTFHPADEPDPAAAPRPSRLTNWPVQIHLIPPNAPFLKGADLLISADCVPVSFPDLHGRFLKDRTVMIGCPKFDDADAYVQKFAAIFSVAGIRSVTVLSMEVPCCSGLARMVGLGMERAGVTIPIEEIVIGIRGEILEGRNPKGIL